MEGGPALALGYLLTATPERKRREKQKKPALS